MAGRVEGLRRAEAALDAELAAGESRRALTLLRGVGPGPGDGDADWVLAVTDRRVLLFTLGTRRQPARLVTTARVGDVRVLDARLRGAGPAVVLRFPDAVLAWFVPVVAWRPETEAVVAALGSALDAVTGEQSAGADLDRADAFAAYPDEDRGGRPARTPTETN